MHLLDLPVMDVCCGAVSFDLSPGCGSYEIKNYCSKTPQWVSFYFFFPPPLSLCFYYIHTGVQEEQCEKKSKGAEDASGLVPYGGDSSDEEDERTHSSKTDYT